MVGGVSLARSSTRVPLVSGLERSKAPQTIGGKQMVRDCIHDRFLLLRGKRAHRKRDRKYLVGPHRGVLSATRNIDYVETTIARRIPEPLEISRGLFA